MKRLGTTDYSVAAMCSGYDAIKVDRGGNDDYYVVLNRAAMVMVDPMDVLAKAAIGAAERNAAKKKAL